MRTVQLMTVDEARKRLALGVGKMNDLIAAGRIEVEQTSEEPRISEHAIQRFEADSARRGRS